MLAKLWYTKGVKCSQCKINKSTPHFFRDRRSKCGFQARCKSCDSKYDRRAAYKRWRETQPNYHPPKPRAPRQKGRTETEYRRLYLAKRRATDPSYREWKAKKEKQYRQTPKGQLRRKRARIRRRARGGRIAPSFADWNLILQAFGQTCAYCLRSDVELTIDHFVPLAKNGATTRNNLVPACSRCNSSKQHKMPSDWCTSDQFARVQGIMVSIFRADARAPAPA